MPGNAVLYVGILWAPSAADADLWGFCGDDVQRLTRIPVARVEAVEHVLLVPVQVIAL